MEKLIQRLVDLVLDLRVLHQQARGEVVQMGRLFVDQADEFAILRADAAKNMGVLAYPMGGYLRTAAGGSPAPDWIAHPAKPGFILKHQPQRLVWVANRNGVHFGLKFF